MRSGTARGIIVPTITVFKEDTEQSIDEHATAEHIDWLIRNGVDAIIPAGSSGEFPSLTTEESKRLFHLAVNVAARRVPVYPATCRYATRDVLELVRAAEGIHADGVMVITPYYMMPGRTEVMEHFREVRGHTELPIILYNNPATTGVEVSHDDIVTLIDEGVVDAVKSSQGEIDPTLKLKSARPDIRSYYGHDVAADRALRHGADGWVSLFPNVFPQLAKCLQVEAVDKAGMMGELLLPCIQFVWGGSAHPVAIVKAALEIQGRKAGRPRRPLQGLSKDAYAKLETLIQELMSKAGDA